jgi:cold shock CspA family protein
VTEPAVVDPRRTRLGEVASFDDAAGYGHLADRGGRLWWFHCTSIADGSRTIAPGSAVRFRLVPGHLGRHEAVDVEPA